MNKRVKELEDQIIYHKNLYYQGKAKISDEDYDRLEDELSSLFPESPVLKMVGSVLPKSNKVKHDKKMLSLEKTYDPEKLKSWIEERPVISTFKYDGSACSLIYEDGLLTNAKTRGDGQAGEGILPKVLYIKDIPKRISNQTTLEVRGEIYCKEDDFIDLSKEMEKLGLERPSSLRNIVAGILGRKDQHELSRYLSFTAFELISNEKFTFEEEKFNLLAKYKFPLPDYALCENWKMVEIQIKKCQTFFNEGDFLVDGLVLTYNQCNLAEELGETSHHPKHKIAFKFQGESKTTKINNIEWNISRNGRCTPVAIVEPVELSGAVVSRVTLHHYGIVEAFQLKNEDKIEIVRSGEVIPKFLRVVESSNEKFLALQDCPSCKSTLVIDEHWLKCINPKCPQRQEQEILYFLKTMGIEEISEMRVKEMMKMGLVKEIPDFFYLKKEDFLTLDKVKDKLANKFYEQIQNAKSSELVKLIQALGIEGLGETKVQKVIDNGYNTLEKISELKLEDIEKIDGFAEKSSLAIIDGLKEKRNLLNKLLKAGIVTKNLTQEKLSSNLRNLKFCITGTLSRPREQIASEIKKHSGIIQDTVNKETNYLVTNDTQSSSSKFQKAQKLGVKIITEVDLTKLLQQQ